MAQLYVDDWNACVTLGESSRPQGGGVMRNEELADALDVDRLGYRNDKADMALRREAAARLREQAGERIEGWAEKSTRAFEPVWIVRKKQSFGGRRAILIIKPEEPSE